MSGVTRLNWKRIVAAVLVAEAMPILLLILVVSIYAMLRAPDGLSPEEFAPLAGNWVGPIGGFIATLAMAWWAARRLPQRVVAHGVAVGVGTAILDFSLAVLLGGGLAVLLAGGAATAILFCSNGGRIVAGVLGGFLAAHRAIQ